MPSDEIKGKLGPVSQKGKFRLTTRRGVDCQPEENIRNGQRKHGRRKKTRRRKEKEERPVTRQKATSPEGPGECSVKVRRGAQTGHCRMAEVDGGIGIGGSEKKRSLMRNGVFPKESHPPIPVTTYDRCRVEAFGRKSGQKSTRPGIRRQGI